MPASCQWEMGAFLWGKEGVKLWGCDSDSHLNLDSALFGIQWTGIKHEQSR